MQLSASDNSVFTSTHAPTEMSLYLRPARGVKLTQQQLDFLSELEAFEAPFLRDRLLMEKIFETERDYGVAFVEFKKFVALACFYGGSLALTSREVDSVWHQFILFTRQYVEFCEKFVGEYLHHEPETLSSPIQESERDHVINLYLKTFGDPPEIWNAASRCSSCMGCRRSCS
jgi:hypothetical protein